MDNVIVKMTIEDSEDKSFWGLIWYYSEDFIDADVIEASVDKGYINYLHEECSSVVGMRYTDAIKVIHEARKKWHDSGICESYS